MNGLLMSMLFLASIVGKTAFAVPITSEEAAELNNAALDYGYGYPVMDKRAGRPTLADYLRLAAMQYELDKEEAQEAQNQEVLAPAGELPEEPEAHSVDKRRYYNRQKYFYRLPRRRYGFWVTAINKMDNGHLKGFLGKHRNIYNVYKRKVMENGL